MILFSVGLYREYFYAENMATNYIESSFIYQAIEDKTQLLTKNLNYAISHDEMTIRDLVYARESASFCYDALIRARNYANEYIESQTSKIFPLSTIQYNGEKISINKNGNFYEASYNLEDAFQMLRGYILSCIEGQVDSKEAKKTLQKVVEDLEWLQSEIPNFSIYKGDDEAILVNYFAFLEKIESNSKKFITDHLKS